MKKLQLLAIATVALLAAPVASFASHWTAVCSTGAIDDADLDQYAFSLAALTFASGQTGTIQAKYNVTNTSQEVNIPPWTTLELAYLDTSTSSSVSATLFRVTRCTGAVLSIASVTSTDSATAHCSTDALSEVVNFGTYNYYIIVTVTRSSTSVSPAAYTLTLF
jgi:hypothetical protein